MTYTDEVVRELSLEKEIKPCPFCGGKAVPVYCENGSSYTSNILYLSKRGTIKCSKCEILLPRVYSKISRAIEAWNRRIDDAEQQRQTKGMDRRELMHWTFRKECSDCKYYENGQCTHPDLMYCNNCELWAPKENDND